MSAYLPSPDRHPIDDYVTPDWLFAHYHRLYNFTIDVCADRHNHKVGRYFHAKSDALTKRWQGRCWCNPPYSNISGFVWHAYAQSQHGTLVVMLLPFWLRKWYYEFVLPHAHIEYLGRVSFYLHGELKRRPPFDSMIAVFPRDRAIASPLPVPPLLRGNG